MRKFLPFLACSVIAATSIATTAQASPNSTYYWDSAQPYTMSLGLTAPSSVCLWSGFGGQTGDLIDNDNLWLSQTTGWNSGGTWEFGGSTTNGEGCGGNNNPDCGYAVRWQVANCTNPNAFYGAGFNHIYVTGQTGFDAFYGNTPVIAEPVNLPNNSPFYCGITSLAGDFTGPGSAANSADGNYYPTPAFELFNSNTIPGSQNRMGTWCFQLQDIYNNAITPHTVNMYVATPGSNSNLPNSTTAYCYLIYIGGSFRGTWDDVQIRNPNNGITDQQLIVEGNAGVGVAQCINYNLAN